MTSKEQNQNINMLITAARGNANALARTALISYH